MIQIKTSCEGFKYFVDICRMIINYRDVLWHYYQWILLNNVNDSADSAHNCEDSAHNCEDSAHNCEDSAHNSEDCDHDSENMLTIVKTVLTILKIVLTIAKMVRKIEKIWLVLCAGVKRWFYVCVKPGFMCSAMYAQRTFLQNLVTISLIKILIFKKYYID